jgi:hypothetical protein
MPPESVGTGRVAWLRWLSPTLRGHPVQILQSTRLTPRATVHVLVWDGKEWLVGCAEHGITVLGQRASPAARDEEPARGRPAEQA